MTGLWFSPATPVSSTNKTDQHDKTEILLKVALNTITINIFSRDKANHVGMGNNNYGRSEPASKTATVTLLPLPGYRFCLYIWRFNVLSKVTFTLPEIGSHASWRHNFPGYFYIFLAGHDYMLVSLVSISTLCIPYVIVSVIASEKEDCGFELRWGQTKGFKMCICCFSATHTCSINKQVEELVGLESG